MKRKNKISEKFDTVKTFRTIKDKISKDIQGMNYEQFKAYLAKTKLKVRKIS